MSEHHVSREFAVMSYAKSLLGFCQLLGGFVVAVLAREWQAAPEALRGAAVGAMFLLVSDTILGVLVACQNHTLSSRGLRRFFVKVLVYLAVIVGAYGVDQVLRAEAFAQTLVVVMICITEASSVFENSSILGFTWPAAVTKRFAALKVQCDADDAKPVLRPRATQDAQEATGGKAEGVQGDER